MNTIEAYIDLLLKSLPARDEDLEKIQDSLFDLWINATPEEADQMRKASEMVFKPGYRMRKEDILKQLTNMEKD